jgi:hypothetical protein
MTAPRADWRPIATAPDDRRWIELWRPDPPAGSQANFVQGRRHQFPDGDVTWVWPCEDYTVMTEYGRDQAEKQIARGDCYESDAFTHWRPLSAPPDEAAPSPLAGEAETAVAVSGEGAGAAATAWAVMHGPRILVSTISETERAAKVNWLVVAAGILVLADWSDRKISAAFNAHRRPGVRVVPVRVTPEAARREARATRRARLFLPPPLLLAAAVTALFVLAWFLAWLTGGAL